MLGPIYRHLDEAYSCVWYYLSYAGSLALTLDGKTTRCPGEIPCKWFGMVDRGMYDLQSQPGQLSIHLGRLYDLQLETRKKHA